MIFGSKYVPTHKDNRMKNEGDVVSARAAFLNFRFPNLDYLLQSRYGWINAYIDAYGERAFFLKLNLNGMRYI
jgi:hypothetical protein